MKYIIAGINYFMSFINKPRIYFWAVIPLLGIIYFLLPKTNFDIQIHDTLIVLNKFHAISFLMLISGIIGLLYYLLRSYKLVNFLSIIHLVVTTLGFAILIYSMWRNQYYKLESIGFASILIQSVLLVNLIIAFSRGKKS